MRAGFYVGSSLSVSLKSDTNSSFSSSSMCDLQKQDCCLHTLPTPSLPPPGSSSGSAGLSDLGRPGAAVSPQQQNASQLPPNAKLRQRTPTNMKTVLRKKRALSSSSAAQWCNVKSVLRPRLTQTWKM